jgi:Bacterial Ig-like domain
VGEDISGGRKKVNAVIRYKILKSRGLLASLAVMLTAALAAALVLVLVANTPALAQSTAADTRHPRVIDVRPAEGATDVSIVDSNNPYQYHKVVAFFSEDMRERSVVWAINVFKKGSDTPITDFGVWYNAQKRKVILEPEIALRRGTTYKAVVSTQAKDLAGNRLDQNRNRAGLQPKVWYFTMQGCYGASGPHSTSQECTAECFFKVLCRTLIGSPLLLFEAGFAQ